MTMISTTAPYKKPLSELGLENRLAIVLERRREGRGLTPFLPGLEGKLYLAHSPEIIREVLVRRHRVFVEDPHPYAHVTSAYSDAGRKVLSLDRAPAGPAAERDAIHGVVMRYVAPLEELAAARVVADLFPVFSVLVLEVMGKALFDVELGDRAERFFRVSMRHEDYLGLSRRGRLAPAEAERAHAEVRDALLEQEAIARSILDERVARGAEIPQSLPRGAPVERALVRTLLNAYAGTATTLSWVALMLASNPEAQEKARTEARAAVTGGGPSPESFPFLLQIVKETLRLYPTAWMMSRTARESASLGGETIPQGASVFVCTYSLHRNPTLWENAETFLPSRFAGSETGGAAAYAYLPFGTGPHRCAGMRYALDTILLVMARLLPRLAFSPAPGIGITPFPRVALQPEPGAVVTLAPASR